MTHSVKDAGPLPPERGLFCNRTLNMRGIKAIGYDMDYTLVHYHIEAWERRAYEHLRERLDLMGLPVRDLEFAPESIIRGLVIDRGLGNVVKANRFGYVKRAFHGTRPLSFEELRSTYSSTMVDLSEPRWSFLNTLFSLSEACMFSQLVDLFDQDALTSFVRSYGDVYDLVRRHIDLTHMEGRLKSEIMADPERFVELDATAALTLLDQRAAGKQLMLITNSEWHYTSAMMSYAFDRFLPEGQTWRDLFDLIIVAAGKPGFFTTQAGFLEIASEDGLLRPVVGPVAPKKAYFGGNAAGVETSLGVSGDEILYIGDHIFGDVHVSKRVLAWRTALIVREIEHEIVSSLEAQDDLNELDLLMQEKEALERVHCQKRLALVRRKAGYGEPLDEAALGREVAALRAKITALDDRISPLAKKAGEVSNVSWGPLMWAGNDKSHFARQVERHADVYTSRVSNFASATPFVYLRSPRGTLPHDVAPAPAAGAGVYAAEPPATGREWSHTPPPSPVSRPSDSGG